MKRAISILLVLAMLLCLPLPAGAAETGTTVTVTPDKTKLSPGDTLNLTITVSDKVEGLTAWQFNLSYDAGVFTMGTPQVSPDAWPSTVVGLSKGTDEASVPISALDVGSAAISLNAGGMVTIPFTVRSDAELGTTNFSLDCETVSTYSTLAEQSSQVTISQAADIEIVKKETATPYNGYTVTLSGEKTVNLGEKLAVKATVSAKDENVTTYNAYDLTVTYDTGKLTYEKADLADTGATISDANGTLTIRGYGNDKTFETAVATLYFQAKAAGETTVKLTSAKVDISTNAVSQNVPEAGTGEELKITVREAYTVTLGEGLTADSTTAVKGEDFTFFATDFANYDYALPVAKIGQTDLTVTNKGDGTYSIAGSLITGPISITAIRTPKSYAVTVDGSGKEDVTGITAETKATYNTPFTFTVTKADGFTYKVTAKAGETELTLTTGENGTYTISGTDITGAITVTVVKTNIAENTVNVDKPDYVKGEATALKGEDYTFTLDKSDDYTYGELEVTVDGKTVTPTQNDDGSYTISGKDITGPIKISLPREEAVTVAVTQYLTLNSQVMWLVTVSGKVPQGSVAKYDGNAMYWSADYSAYAWLVISGEGEAAVLATAKEKVTTAEGTATTLDTSGDVNKTGKTDINDAQLVYDMYNKHYSDFSGVEMEKFLRADVSHDKKLDTQDAAAIISAIKGS